MSEDRHDSPVPGAIPAATPLRSGAPSGGKRAEHPFRPSVFVPESSGSRLGRRARRVRLYLLAFAAVGLLVYVAALASSNTHRVHVDWVFGSSSVSLLWLVLLATILGWLVGLLVAAAFRWRTRAPRSS